MRKPALDSRTRALAKATTWRLLATLITAACAWLVTGEPACAASIGALDTLIKFGSYYLHERAWDRATIRSPDATSQRAV